MLLLYCCFFAAAQRFIQFARTADLLVTPCWTLYDSLLYSAINDIVVLFQVTYSACIVFTDAMTVCNPVNEREERSIAIFIDFSSTDSMETILENYDYNIDTRLTMPLTLINLKVDMCSMHSACWACSFLVSRTGVYPILAWYSGIHILSAACDLPKLGLLRHLLFRGRLCLPCRCQGRQQALVIKIVPSLQRSIVQTSLQWSHWIEGKIPCISHR